MSKEFLYNGLLDVVVGNIIEMIQNGSPVTVDELVLICGYEKVAILKALGLLLDIGVLIKNDKDEYELIKQLQANHLVSAGQINLNLQDFDYFSINAKQKQLALELATSKDKVKDLDISSRKPLFNTRNYLIGKHSDEIYQTLALILESTNEVLVSYIAEMAKKDKKLAIYLEMQSQAENALIKYTDKMK